MTIGVRSSGCSISATSVMRSLAGSPAAAAHSRAVCIGKARSHPDSPLPRSGGSTITCERWTMICPGWSPRCGGMRHDRGVVAQADDLVAARHGEHLVEQGVMVRPAGADPTRAAAAMTDSLLHFAARAELAPQPLVRAWKQRMVGRADALDAQPRPVEVAAPARRRARDRSGISCGGWIIGSTDDTIEH